MEKKRCLNIKNIGRVIRLGKDTFFLKHFVDLKWYNIFLNIL